MLKLFPASSVKVSALPDVSLLKAYATSGAYTDCYMFELGRAVSLSQYMAAFYTTPAFKLERWILGILLRLPSTDNEALALSRGEASRFAAWTVESREATQTILAAGRTRSWLMVCPRSSGTASATVLYFGSAIVHRPAGGRGWHFTALLGFHRLYSRVLLGTAARRLARTC
jgi:hypothetical protein